MDRALSVALIALCWSVVFALTGVSFAACVGAVSAANAANAPAQHLSQSSLRR